EEGKAVIALGGDGAWAGFCYIETWDHGQFLANSGLIVNPEFRGKGVARAVKRRIFQLSRDNYPDAKIFGLTTGRAVMKINSELGYLPVTYSELTQNDAFWKNCQSCVNYPILQSKNRKNCMCTAMMFDPGSTKEADDSEKGNVVLIVE
ncbi:MAG: GNAT family N-acetyltransferase, partial [Bacteroidetes bacterium]|nr:GNAT family N-acetyltransferase [Bacteroidota bacterium]